MWRLICLDLGWACCPLEHVLDRQYRHG
jgi:hypothetical protein